MARVMDGQSAAKRLTLTFDTSDEAQRMVYDVLKSAGYGQRAPLVVKAMSLLMGCNPAQEDGRLEEDVSDVIDRIVRKAATEAVMQCVPALAAELVRAGAVISNSSGVQEVRVVQTDSGGPVINKAQELGPKDDLCEGEMSAAMLEDALRMAEMFG